MNSFQNIFLWCLMMGACAVSPASAAVTRLALTFDDLPSSGVENPTMSRKEISDRIIRTLKDHKITKTYGFINGITLEHQVERYQILNDWKNAGQLFGNHTYSHFDYAAKSFEEFRKDIERNEPFLIDFAKTIEELKVLRLPYLQEGENNDKRYALRAYLKKREYVISQVTVDFHDWAFSEPFVRCSVKKDASSLKALKELFLSQAMKHLAFARRATKVIWGNRDVPQILLLHYNSVTATWLDELLTKIRETHWKIIPADVASRDPLFKEDTTFVGPSGKSFLLQAVETRKIKSVEPIEDVNDQLDRFCR